MEGAKRKTLKTSSLERISGIGPAKAKQLLKHFGTLGAIRTASIEQLLQVKGISQKDAHAIATYFQQE
jgi:excinuclease ABC subunit C